MVTSLMKTVAAIFIANFCFSHGSPTDTDGEGTPPSCRFGRSMLGAWHQAGGAQPLRIAPNGTMDDKGECVQHNGNYGQYVFRLSGSSGDCYRCLLMFSRHHNVLQYKETQCLPKGDLRALCQPLQFSDSKLNTLFRADNLEPTACPIGSPATFTYAHSKWGRCEERVSQLDRCSRADMLSLKFRACPGGREQRDEQVQCIGSWETRKAAKFFAGKIVNRATGKPSDKYRCFIYEPTSSGGKLGISADATCWELRWSTDEAEMSIDYTFADAYPSAACKFDREFSSHVWQSLSQQTYEHRVKGDTWKVAKAGVAESESESICIKRENLGTMHRYTIYRVQGCTRGYYCVEVYRRTGQIIELLWGKLAPSDYLPCTDEYFASVQGSRSQHQTMIASPSVESACPHRGRYSLSEPAECGQRDGTDTATLSVGCRYDAAHRVVLSGRAALDECHADGGLVGAEVGDMFNCHGDWSEDTASGTIHYVVLRHKATGAPSCIIYSRSADQHLLNLRSYSHSCVRLDAGADAAGDLAAQYGVDLDSGANEINLLPLRQNRRAQPVNATVLRAAGKCGGETSSTAALNANEHLSSSGRRASTPWHRLLLSTCCSIAALVAVAAR